MNSSDIVKTIRAINKDAQIVVYGNDLDTCTIQWDVGEEISKADIQTKMDELQAEYDALAYARAREWAYPITKEFIEAYTEKEIGGDSTKWDAYIVKYNKVRSDIPKP